MPKKPEQPARTKKQPPSPAPAEPSAIGAQNVILERIEEQQRVVIEAVTMTREALRREMGELKLELASRMDVLEVAVRKNSDDIRKNSDDIRKNSDDIRKNSDDIPCSGDLVCGGLQVGALVAAVGLPGRSLRR